MSAQGTAVLEPLERAAMERLLNPRSVAIVGASDRPGALGASVLKNLVDRGFSGEIHLVNPKREEIGGRRCVPDVAALPEDVDVAVLAIPQAAVLDAVRELAQRRCGAAVIFSAGFAEGGPEGLARQEELARIARDSGMVIEGPNCLGLVNFDANVALTFVELPEARARGDRKVGIVSQSGAMAAVLATTMIAREVPLSCYISTGNEAASGVEDYVAHLAEDPAIGVIAMIVEQFRKPAAFLAAARAARERGKLVVLLHPGSSEAGRESAATHTGAMAGDHAVMRTLVEHAGVILVDGLEVLGDVTEIAIRCPSLPSGSVGIISESGALKAMMLDGAEALGLELPKLTDADSPALREALPSFVPVSNPLDITAQGLVDPTLYNRTIAALGEERRIETILVPLIQTDTHTSHVKFSAVAKAIAELGGRKPLIVAGVDEGGGVLGDDVAAIRALGSPYFPTPERALKALACLAWYGAHSSGLTDRTAISIAGPAAGETIPEYRAKQLLAPHGLTFSRGALAGSLEAAQEIAAGIGYPVVLKAQAAALSHKSDAGGVAIGIADSAALAAAWGKMEADVQAARPGLVLDGILVEAMAPRGVEMIVGARRDPDWGAVILVGFGGVAAELLHDAVLLPPDLSRAEIKTRILSLRMAPLLQGFRGAPIADVDALAGMVETLAVLVRGTPGIGELDLNPVLVLPEGKGVIALDALISG
ncbi:acetate--CoA ligase family protein [Novosphingobium aerophilum]|uniref:acetate--CoA ligase family protein n=1 Tax=Novosphingobium TaxID=165696 RepID=UPI0006C8648A|nr:acetate--CoA ligase family protein [Novosphingobium sp. ST904]KPH62561.1 CoA-binding protein [Novosphingobium sp. ST904]TCM33078.1 acyl-CoA synthetase (NDP forming) [Novosphingobium sp. ST904]